MIKTGLLALLFTLNMAIAAAQSADTLLVKDSLSQARIIANKDFIHLYKENSELSYTSPKGEIGAPSKYVLNGKLTTTYMLLASSKIPIAFAVIPDFTARVRDEKSAGVRTPSFRLGGMMYVRLNQSPNDYKYASLAFTHHSNGQDQEARNPDGTINTKTGNFNTNYLTASYNFGKTLSKANEVFYTLNHHAGFEWHKWFNNEPVLEGDYGFTRLIYDFSLRKYQQDKENWRLNAGLNYAINQMTAYDLTGVKKRLNVETSFHYAFPFMNNVFLMAAAGYYGEDPYNIYFQDKYGYMRFGISSGFTRNKRR